MITRSITARSALLLRSTSKDFPSGLGNTEGLVGRYLHDHPREWWAAAPGRRLPALDHPVYVARVPHDGNQDGGETIVQIMGYGPVQTVQVEEDEQGNPVNRGGEGAGYATSPPAGAKPTPQK